MNNLSPVTAPKRIPLIDSLRGFALFGILFVNMTWFTGFAVLSPEARSSVDVFGTDSWVYFLVHVFVDGKFWTIFAFLFGLGVAIQFNRAANVAKFRRLYVRRILTLLLIGLAHAVFLWFGDIVSLYAACGLILLLFLNRSDRGVLIWGLILLLAPIAQLGIWLMVHRYIAVPETNDPGYGPASALVYFGSGTYFQTLIANWEFLKERWLIAIYDGRFLKLSGMFLLGWWAGRKQVFSQPHQHQRLLIAIASVGLSLGLATNLFVFSAFEGVSLRPPTVDGWIVESIKTIGIPALALGILAFLTLLWSRFEDGLLAHCFAIAGRMSLTNYVMQSVIGVTIFYGYGLGRWGQLGITQSLLVILIIFALQVALSQIWLSRFQFGPLEWLWRCMTYGRWLPIRKFDLSVSSKSATKAG